MSDTYVLENIEKPLLIGAIYSFTNNTNNSKWFICNGT
jgi:hypothetical protein